MALTITRQCAPFSTGGGLKECVWRVVDDGPAGGDLDVSNEFNHIYWVDAKNLSSGESVATTWTEGSETIAISAAASDDDVVMVRVLGT